MVTRTHIGVLGGGSWGTAIAHLLRTASTPQPTLLWLRDPEMAQAISKERTNSRYLPGLELAAGIETTGDLQEVAERCELIFVVVPTKVMRPVMREIGDHLGPDQLLVSCSKGLEPGTAKRMTELLREETQCPRTGALSGPNLAKEVVLGHPSATVVASHYDEVVVRVQKALFGPRFRVYGNPDPIGVELCGALKNVVAIAAGVVEGLGFGDNTKAMLVTRGLAEIARFLGKLGGHEATMAGLAGMGDLMVTCGSALSRNHQVGVRLAKGQSLAQIHDEMRQVAEGVNTVRVACEIGDREGFAVPISRAVYSLVHEGKPAASAIADLMSIAPSWETERRRAF